MPNGGMAHRFLHKRPFISALLLICGAVGACELIVRFELAHRGFGALFWIPVVLIGLTGPRRAAIFAAVLSASSFNFFFIDPVREIGSDYAGFGIMLLCMSGVALYTNWHARSPARSASTVIGPEDGAEYVEESLRGARDAEEFLRRLYLHRQGFLLGWVVRDMIVKGKFGGAEAGFFCHLSNALLVGSMGLVAGDRGDYDTQNLNMCERVVDAENDVETALAVCHE